ncbi:KipI family sensor histidine kinase inhibitor [Ochrobactrum sp. 19YEA23]|uniref:5-oxoprolinase subunit PxpB n=1 Tax=Ochrobactrum sp. 19YEA23 TaxID=3039854 RepID=UPI00247A32EC|nr:KipI family sensor histidine kinase inhibitor [Ochrobactrum sp. 19YEA23]
MTDVASLLISDMGERAVLCQLPPTALSLQTQERFWALSEELETYEGVGETIPGMNNLLIGYDANILSRDALVTHITRLWSNANGRPRAGKLIEIPVRYGGTYGEDLPTLAQSKGLSTEEFVRLHVGGDYIVYALGSQPGFGYLGGLDPLLSTPRRDTPRLSVKAGSVIIGGDQTAVQARTSPSGWHVIGETDLEFFNIDHSSPALLVPGDRVRFIIEDILS